MDLFEGRWVLDPAQNRYEHGDAPLNAVYQIEVIDGIYHVTMKWVAANDKHMEMRYEANPDGREYPATDSPAVDTICTKRIDEYRLDTEARKDGVTVALAHRVISQDGRMMTVSQIGHYPDGGMYTNRSVYYRMKD